MTHLPAGSCSVTSQKDSGKSFNRSSQSIPSAPLDLCWNFINNRRKAGDRCCLTLVSFSRVKGLSSVSLCSGLSLGSHWNKFFAHHLSQYTVPRMKRLPKFLSVPPLTPQPQVAASNVHVVYIEDSRKCTRKAIWCTSINTVIPQCFVLLLMEQATFLRAYCASSASGQEPTLGTRIYRRFLSF